MRSSGPRSLRFLLAAALFAVALLPVPAAQAQAQSQERVVSKQEFIEKLGGAQPAPSQPQGVRLRGPGGVKALAQAAQAPKEIAISIHFKYDSTDLADEFSRNQLREAGEAFSSDELRGLAFEIGGHTDSLGADAYNLDLSVRRAQAVKDALCRGSQADCGKLLVKGYGKSQPVAGNDDEAGRALNRRVVFKRLD